MRALIFLLFLSFAGLHSASLAQDTFGGVTNEPRPSEYLHWGAEDFARIKGELGQSLVDGNGIWEDRHMGHPLRVRAGAGRCRLPAPQHLHRASLGLYPAGDS